MEHCKTHCIPLHTPIHAPGKVFVSADIDVQAIGLVTPTPFVGRHVRLAVILRIAGRTRVHDLDDDASVDLVVGRGAVGADVVDAVAGAAPYCCRGAGRRHVVGGRILATVGCAGRGFRVR